MLGSLPHLIFIGVYMRVKLGPPVAYASRTLVLICAHNHFLSLIILVNKHCYPWRRLAAGVALTDLVSCVGSWREISCIYVLVRFWLFSILQHTRLAIVLSSYGRGMAIIPTINQYQLHSSE